MIKSMTGYGKGESINKLGAISVEIRSLNHKYFDLISRLPNQLAHFEDKTRDAVQKKVRRGRISLTVSWEGNQRRCGADFTVNMDLARKYHQQLLKLKKFLKLDDNLGLAQIIALPDVLTYEQKKISAEQVWPYLKEALEEAVEQLDRTRQAEGRRLLRDLMNRIKRINRCVDNIGRQLPKVIERYRKGLLQKMRSLSAEKISGQERLSEEVALFIRNCDVSEELTRIKSHLKGFESALRNPKEAGKELDFIAQELFREANTIGAKASDVQISRWVITVKSQIEKIREQLQNIE